MRRGLAGVMAVLLAGCATDLLVGGADTEAGTGSGTAGDDAPGDDAPTSDGGVGSGGGGTTDSDGDTTVGVEGSTDAGEDASESGLETGRTTSQGTCEAGTVDDCTAMEGCVWSEGEGCGPVPSCAALAFEDCMNAGGQCLWFGEPATGICDGATNCGSLTMDPCDEALVCGWIEGACDTLPCEEQNLDACEFFATCDVVGPMAEPFCVSDDCLGECAALDDVMCGEAVGCHFAGTNDDGNCLSVECFDCAVLTPDECTEATQCDYAELEMACQPAA